MGWLGWAGWGRRQQPFEAGTTEPSVKASMAVEKYGIPLAIDASPANVHDTKGILPILRQLAGREFQGPAIGDRGYRGERLPKAAETLGLPVRPSPLSIRPRHRSGHIRTA